ncbi:hypothetical protein ZWY2020_036844 [Hordeum vulgare]|nr:hypothetical protein ZWY2020_036844 [Hordeum vulgare]
MAEKGAAGAELLPLQSQVELELQRSPQFLMKTYQLVDDPAVDDVISWSEGGSSFVVLRPVEFERDILPKHFNIDDFFSFVQRLDYLGFRKIVADRWEFRHACFRRGGEHLLSDICRLEWKMVWSYWLMAAAAPTSMVAGVVTFATLVVRMALGCPEAPVCALVDAMFRLPAKLDKLLVSYCHMLPRGAKDEIPLIKQDLERMIAFIQEHDDSGVEDRSMMVKCMTKEVRELSYDMEDCRSVRARRRFQERNIISSP